MNFDIEKQILDYLEKHYVIKDKKYHTVYGNVHEWGVRVCYTLTNIFDVNDEFVRSIFILWATSNGLTDEEYNAAFKNGIWTVETVQDLQVFHNIDVEAELTVLLTEQLSQEINREILRNIFSLSGGTTIHLKGE